MSSLHGRGEMETRLPWRPTTPIATHRHTYCCHFMHLTQLDLQRNNQQHEHEFVSNVEVPSLEHEFIIQKCRKCMGR